MPNKEVSNDDFKRDLNRLREGFQCLAKLTTAESIDSNCAKSAYDNALGNSDAWQSITAAKAKPSFDESMYPSLFGSLQVLPDETHQLKSWWKGLADGSIDWWTDERVKKEMAQSPLLRALVAFLWKQGELRIAATLLGGLQPKNDNQKQGNAAVMRQFAAHLLDPLNQPIFDQHTSRAMLLLNHKQNPKWWTKEDLSPSDYKRLFGRGGVPTTDSLLTNAERRTEYVKWWSEHIKQRLPSLGEQDASDWKQSSRAQALLWTDRFMFSLGKAAGGLCGAKIEGEQDVARTRRVSPSQRMIAQRQAA